MIQFIYYFLSICSSGLQLVDRRQVADRVQLSLIVGLVLVLISGLAHYYFDQDYQEAARFIYYALGSCLLFVQLIRQFQA